MRNMTQAKCCLNERSVLEIPCLSACSDALKMLEKHKPLSSLLGGPASKLAIDDFSKAANSLRTCSAELVEVQPCP